MEGAAISSGDDDGLELFDMVLRFTACQAYRQNYLEAGKSIQSLLRKVNCHRITTHTPRILSSTSITNMADDETRRETSKLWRVWKTTKQLCYDRVRLPI